MSDMSPAGANVHSPDAGYQSYIGAAMAQVLKEIAT
jgi:hypothetical protein